MDDSSDQHLTLKVKLTDLLPEVSRTVRVPADITIHQLHMILQVSMGWNNHHLYVFDTGERRWALPGVECCEDLRDVQTSLDTTVEDLALKPGDTFTYWYDLSACWRHEVRVMSAQQSAPDTPECTAGVRACPPEDCGGVFGYHRLLRAWRDLSDPEHEDARRWLGEDFDPDFFSLEFTNWQLAWYWQHRAVEARSDSITELYDDFLAEMKEEVAHGTWLRYRRDLQDTMQFLDDMAVEELPVDSYLLYREELDFTEVATFTALLLTIDIYFQFYLVWRRVASDNIIAGCRATLRRLILWLRQQDHIDKTTEETWRSAIAQQAEEALNIRREYWFAIEYPAQEMPSDIIRRGMEITRTGENSVDLVDPYTSRVFEGVRVPPHLAQQMEPGMLIGAEITMKDTGFLTGALLLHKDSPLTRQV